MYDTTSYTPDAYIFMTYGNYPNFDVDSVYINYEIIENYKVAVDTMVMQKG